MDTIDVVAWIRSWFPRAAALLLVTTSLVWFWTFGFTAFRAHQRIPMLAIAGVTLAYAILLAARYAWVVLSSIVLSLLAAVAAVFLQARAGVVNPFLATVTLATLLYAGGLGWALKVNRLLQTRRSPAHCLTPEGREKVSVSKKD